VSSPATRSPGTQSPATAVPSCRRRSGRRPSMRSASTAIRVSARPTGATCRRQRGLSISIQPSGAHGRADRPVRCCFPWKGRLRRARPDARSGRREPGVRQRAIGSRLAPTSSEAQERVVQAGVAVPADKEPAEVVQPGERSSSTQRTRPSPEPSSVQAGDHRFHASAPQLATVLVVVITVIGDHRVRTASSSPSARGNRRAAPPRPRSGSPWPRTKRQTTPAICRNAEETGAKSGKTRTP
jgi:hypothetical protein